MRFKLLLSQFCITVGFLTLACLVLLEAPPRVSNFFKNSQKNKIFSLFQSNKEDKLKASKIAGELADKSTLPILRKGLRDVSPEVVEISALLIRKFK